MKTWKLLLPVPFAAALIAMAPQDPKPAKDPTQIVRISEMQYVDSTGKSHVVSSRHIVEIRLLENVRDAIRIEILYENGDYSLIDAQAIHVLRTGRDLMDVRLVRSETSRQRFAELP